MISASAGKSANAGIIDDIEKPFELVLNPRAELCEVNLVKTGFDAFPKFRQTPSISDDLLINPRFENVELIESQSERHLGFS
jgi:hypothetical protein